jgi:hypothetical protein
MGTETMVISLEDNMVAAHKMGVVVFNKYGDVAAPHLVQMMQDTELFDTVAERMAFLAGFHGAMRRAKQKGSVH